MISTEQNREGNLDFFAGIIGDDGRFTSESDGFSYKKILCIAYDLAVNNAYCHDNFIRFVYHDGGLETLDDRKKEQFLNYVRRMPDLLGTQYILTLIDTDLPDHIKFTDEEIAITLHDDGPEGLLFKMEAW